MIFAIILLAAVGVGTMLAGLNVAYRDFRYVIPFVIQVWMFATPTVYMQPDPDKEGILQSMLALNPMTGLIANFRAACLGGPIAWVSFGIASHLRHCRPPRWLSLLPPSRRRLCGHHLIFNPREAAFMEQARVGIIGYGYWGPNLVRNFSTCPLTEVAAVCDASPTRLESFRTELRALERGQLRR